MRAAMPKEAMCKRNEAGFLAQCVYSDKLQHAIDYVITWDREGLHVRFQLDNLSAYQEKVDAFEHAIGFRRGETTECLNAVRRSAELGHGPRRMASRAISSPERAAVIPVIEFQKTPGEQRRVT